MAAPLRVGLIGCGLGASKHVPAYERQRAIIQVAAVCDVNATAAARVAERLGTQAVYGDVATMLREAAIDAVDICTVHDQHFAHAMAALAAGKHVLVEKPMATTLDDCRAMAAAAEKVGKILMVAHHQRFDPKYRAIRQVIASGELGAIQAVLAVACLNVSGVPAGHWMFDGQRAGGGVTMTLGLNLVDMCRWAVCEVAAVKGAVCRRNHAAFRHGAEDQVFALLELANGAVAEIFASYTSWSPPSGRGERIEIHGEKGTLVCAGQGPVLVASEQRSGKEFVPLPVAGAEDMYGQEIRHFAECVRTGNEPDCGGRDVLKTMEVVYAIYAADKGVYSTTGRK